MEAGAAGVRPTGSVGTLLVNRNLALLEATPGMLDVRSTGRVGTLLVNRNLALLDSTPRTLDMGVGADTLGDGCGIWSVVCAVVGSGLDVVILVVVDVRHSNRRESTVTCPSVRMVLNTTSACDPNRCAPRDTKPESPRYSGSNWLMLTTTGPVAV